MKYCQKCGQELKENVAFCKSCGSQVNNNTNQPIIDKKNIIIQVVLSMVTCGIYNLVWFVQMTDNSNTLSSSNKTASGGKALLYTLLTCGIYRIYWYYKTGKKMYEAGIKYQKQIDDNSILYLVLSLFSLSLVNDCLIQADLNKFAS